MGYFAVESTTPGCHLDIQIYERKVRSEKEVYGETGFNTERDAMSYVPSPNYRVRRFGKGKYGVEVLFPGEREFQQDRYL